MKTILTTVMNIVIILLVAAIISGGFSLYVNNTSTSGSGGESGRPAMTNSDGTMPARPEGGDAGSSIGQGLLQVLTALAKLAGITVVVLLIEKGVTLLGKRAPRATTA
jgi:hypothetical protein